MTTFATRDLATQHHRELVAEAERRRSVKNIRSGSHRRRSPARAFRTWLEAGQL
jgi:hypothetical protein